MDNLVSETNAKLESVIENLETIKKEYEKKLKANDKEINTELSKVRKYKKDFFLAKEKVEKMNSDIEGFSEDYKKLVERFKDDELANILVAANKEISLKIEERKRKIIKDKASMNELVEKAEKVKEKLVTLTQEKNALESCYVKICDSEEYYRRSLNEIIDYANENKENLCSYFDDADAIINSAESEEPLVDLNDIEFDMTKEIDEDDASIEEQEKETDREDEKETEVQEDKEENEKESNEFNDEEFILAEQNDEDEDEEQKEEKKDDEFTLEEIPSELDDIDKSLESFFSDTDTLEDDDSIYNKDED